MTIIEQIKAEIERNRQAIRVLNEHTALEQMSKTCAIFQYSDSILSELLSFLDTLEESEKPMNQDELEEEYKDYVENDPVYSKLVNRNAGLSIARHFYELGCRRTAEKYDEIEYNRQRAEESVPNDLEEAAEEYAGDSVSDEGMMEVAAYIAGAKWQKQHDAELIEIAYNDGITIGMTKQKEQIMKEAVEGTVYDCGFPARLSISACLWPLKVGDKVRMILLPKES